MGSVFSPYYAWSGRRDPENHSAMNVVLFGSKKRFAMTERGRHALVRDRRSIAIGPSRMAWDGRSLSIDLDEVTAPLPSRIRGRITLHPQAVTARSLVLDDAGQHHWWPIAPQSRVEVELDRPRLKWSGWGYFDANWGEVPLQHSFQQWDWCRAPLDQGTAVLYNTVLRNGAPRSLAIHFEPGQGITDLPPLPEAVLAPTLWRIRRSTRSEAPGQARVVRTLLDAPFYARSEVRTRLLGQDVTGIHESLSLKRLSSPLVQSILPFRMPRRFL